MEPDPLFSFGTCELSPLSPWRAHAATVEDCYSRREIFKKTETTRCCLLPPSNPTTGSSAYCATLGKTRPSGPCSLVPCGDTYLVLPPFWA